jgi:LSD1 subclass zinc finger protein
MPIRVKCGNCKKMLSVKDQYAGKKIRCPSCQTVLPVPMAAGQNGEGGQNGTGGHNGTTVAVPAGTVKKPEPSSKPAPAAKKPVAKAKPASDVKAPIPAKKIVTELKPAAEEGKKPAADGKKPVAAVKKPATGTKHPGSNGKPAAPDPAGPFPPPPEHVEAEALSVFAEKDAPPEEEAPPQFIDFRCEWCDEEVRLPMELAGKQAQCPNQECRRIIKVPLPKVVEKKDWRKMDRRGPAAALVNQPEQLENAWGTQEAMRARQASLAQAGAIELPPRPSLGAAGWILRGTYFTIALAVLATATLGVLSLYTASRQHKSIQKIKALVDADSARSADPVLLAEVHRVLGLLYLESEEKGKAESARQQLQGAVLRNDDDNAKDPGVNQPLFLIELALAQIELGGNEDEILRKAKIPWELVREDLETTLQQIRPPILQAQALREVATRLIEKNQLELALGLAGGLAGDAENKRPAFNQEISLYYLLPEQKERPKTHPKIPDPTAKDIDPNARIGYAEGYARKDEFDKADALCMAAGPARDRLEACLGVAAIALSRQKTKNAGDFVKKALEIAAEDKERSTSPWLLLHLVKLGARTGEDPEALKKVVDRLEGPFKTRADLELFLAKCDAAPGRIAPEELATLEAGDKEGVALALGWYALARQHARKGAKRDDIEKTFSEHPTPPDPDTQREKVRRDQITLMVEVGSYLAR